ncbi:MAG TPA: YfhO family protein [Blastocatellia bacterium]|nr:YfhO family protein [Blastocatellia bacterium]
MSISRKLLGFRRHFGTEIFALTVLVIFFAAMFQDALFSERFILIGDPLKEFYPLRKTAWDLIRQGTLPVWTPYILSGYPLLSMTQIGIGYPLTWGYLFLSGYWAEQVYVLAPYLLSSIFTFAYLRQIGRSHVAALLGGLVYGYGGFLLSPIGLIGSHANSALWLPLVLIGIARAQTAPFLPCLLISTAGYTMSVLAGSPQMFVYLGFLALAYGVFLGLFPDPDRALESKRWRPLGVISGAMLFSAGLAAFQLMETSAIVRMSVRKVYRYDQAGEGSYERRFALNSLLEPISNYWDSSTYVPLLAVGLAAIAVVYGVLRSQWRRPILFWAGVAGMAWLLILGTHSSIYNLYFHLPLVSRFRYPSRHSMEWTLAIGVLAAYGWDVMDLLIRRPVALSLRQWRWQMISAVAGGVSLLAAVIGAYAWWSYTKKAGLDIMTDLNNAFRGLHPAYLGWKAGFTLAIIVTLLLFNRLINGRLRIGLLAGTLAIYCLVEPYIWVISPIAVPLSYTARDLDSFGETTPFLRERLGDQHRNFSLVHPYEISSGSGRAVDAVNWTALAGIQDLNGYESLIMERYSRALFHLPGESVSTEPFVRLDQTVLGSRSKVLDLLNTRFITSHSSVLSIPPKVDEKEGIRFHPGDRTVDLRTDAAFHLHGEEIVADTLALVTMMTNSTKIEQGAPVAKITIRTVEGRVVERFLRAGIDSSEFACDRPDVQAKIRHARAPIYDSWPGDPQHSYSNHRYLARVDLGERLPVRRIEIVKLVETGGVLLCKTSLYDSASRRSEPLPVLSPERWRPVYDKNGITIVENLHALPRVWLTTWAEALGSDEILRRIRGDSEVPFDPRMTALVEVEPHKLPALSGAPLSAESYARVVSYEPNRIVIETESDQAAVLVVSELHYPGWRAMMDGEKTQIHQTDYLLRGVFVEPGKHTVEMSYQAPGLRTGALVSLATLLLIGGLIVFTRYPLKSIFSVFNREVRGVREIKGV